MGNVFETDGDDGRAHNGTRSDVTEEKGGGKPMMDEVIAALRALANIFDLISRNLNKRK